MNRPDIDAIEKRTQMATPGPWEWWPGNPWHANAPNHPLRDKISNAPEVFSTGNSNHGFFYKPGAMEQAKKDTEFIAAARSDVPELIAYIRYLEGK